MNLQGIEFARKKERQHNSHPCEFARIEFSRKSRSGIRKEQYLRGKEFARNGLCKECGLCCVYQSSVGD